jgi:predicted protein tyrosine phosphatase
MQPALAIHHVCGLEELGLAPLSAADRIVSILDPGAPVPTELHLVHVPLLVLRFDDAIRPNKPDRPTMAHIEELVAFDVQARAEDRLLVHCTAGISRSTAALAILLAARHPKCTDEIFDAIRQLRPAAWPNLLMVTLGDELLGRQGALVAALSRHYAVQLRHPQLGAAFRENARAEEIPPGLDGNSA